MDFLDVKSFGAVGDGETDDTEAIQAAIDRAAPYVWRGSTRSTEIACKGGTVFFPAGRYRFTRKLRLAPGIRLVGSGPESFYNEFAGPVVGAGTVLFADFTAWQTYVIDTSPFDRSGRRRDDVILWDGDASSSGDATFAENISLEHMSLEGTWRAKGVNLAGAVRFTLRDVKITGFTVGVRVSSSWYGAMYDTRITASWRGLVTNASVTTLGLFNFSTQRPPNRNYDPAVHGFDTGVTVKASTHAWTASRSEVGAYTSGYGPRTTAAWTEADQDARATGIYNVAGAINGYGVTIEGWEVGYASWCGRDAIHGLYLEGIARRSLQLSGVDDGFSFFDVYKVVTPAAYLLWDQHARMKVVVRTTNYTRGNPDGRSGAYRAMFEYLDTLGREDLYPWVEGAEPNASSDPVVAPAPWAFKNLIAGASAIAGPGSRDAGHLRFPATKNPTDDPHTLDDYEKGTWSPILRIGDNAYATAMAGGTFQKIGRLVFVSFHLSPIAAVAGHSGEVSIGGLPFTSGPRSEVQQGGGAITLQRGTRIPAGAQLVLPPGQTALRVVGHAGSDLLGPDVELAGYAVYNTPE